MPVQPSKSKQFSFSLTPSDHSLVIDAIRSSGLSQQEFLRRSALLAAGQKLPTCTGCTIHDSLTNRPVQVDAVSQPVQVSNSPESDLSESGGVENETCTYNSVGSSQKPAVKKSMLNHGQIGVVERARAHAGALKKKSNKLGDRSSLRSDQVLASLVPVSASARDPELDAPLELTDDATDDAPWPQPNELKATLKLSSGEVVTNIWIWANACRLPGNDVDRILGTPSHKVFRIALLRCFARSLRDIYVRQWCSAYNKRTSNWRDTFRSNLAFMEAAKFWAKEYITRKMTATQFIEAANELRPKSLKFVTADMLGNSIGARVVNWIPEEQRDKDKPWSAHEDQSGNAWLTPHGEQPVRVIRSAADRDRLLKDLKIR